MAAERVGHDLQQRTLRFAVAILRFVRDLPSDVAARTVARQLSRCGTGIGANVAEAQDAQSRREFARKMTIARGEARETPYWLKVVQAMEMIDVKRCDAAIREANELLSILVAISRKAKGAEA